jgi:hypothetical protein
MELTFIKWFIGAMLIVVALVSVESMYQNYTIGQCKEAYAGTNRKPEDIRRICNR